MCIFVGSSVSGTCISFEASYQGCVFPYRGCVLSFAAPYRGCVFSLQVFAFSFIFTEAYEKRESLDEISKMLSDSYFPCNEA